MQLTDQAVKFIFQQGKNVLIYLSVRFMAQLQQLQGFAIALKYAYRAIIGSKGDNLVSPGRRAICSVERNKMRKDNDIFGFAQRY